MKKILVIDDDIQFNNIFCMILERAGYEVRSAFNGVEGLKLFTQERPDLVITDIYMPEKEGLETILELRQNDKSIAILVVSGGFPGMDMADILNTSTLFGANGILPKPFTMSALLEKVNGLIGE